LKKFVEQIAGLSRGRLRPIVATIGAAGAVYLLSRVLFASPATTYRTVSVTRDDLAEVVLATGLLQPIRQVDVGTRVSGQLKTLQVKLGDHVKAGQLLAEIDPTVPESELRAAQAQLDNLEAQKRALVAKARRSRLELERQRGMIKGATTSRRDLEAAEALALEDEAGVAAIEARAAQAKSQTEIARANLSYTQITAPIEGDVVGVLTQQGQTVVAVQVVPVILKLAQLDSMTVRTQVPEADVIHVKVGQPVSFTIMGDPDKRYSGKLRAVELAPQNYSEPTQPQGVSASTSGLTPTGGSTAVFYNALFDVANPDRRLRIGMTAQVSITLGVSKDALTVPASVLHDQEADGRYRLKLLGNGGRIEDRHVRIGINNHVGAEVLEGLKEGEKVIVGEATAAEDGGGARP
jgi:membrane fusion protein, macrolide-specific efflux system